MNFNNKTAAALIGGTLTVVGMAAIVAPAQAATPQAVAAASAASKTPKKWIMPVVLTIHNETKHEVTFDSEGIIVSDSHTIDPGGTLQLDGAAWAGADIEGSFIYPSGNTLVKAGNPVIGEPWVQVGVDNHDFSEGESHQFTQGGHTYSVTRATDHGVKDFQMSIRS